MCNMQQSFTSNWPRALWLAVDARGLTLLRRGSRAALVSHDHDQLLAVSPAPRALLLVTRADRKHAKLVLSTDQVRTLPHVLDNCLSFCISFILLFIF